MAEKYLDNSGVSRLLQGVNTFVNNAYKNVFTKMIEVDSYETVDLQPNQIIKIAPAVDGPMTINFIAHTKPNAEYELIADVTQNATITYNGNVLWENGEFVSNNLNTVRLKFTTFDSGSVYLAEYTLYSLENRLLYYSTTNDSEVSLTGLEYTSANIPETQIGNEIYTRALLFEGSNVDLGSQFKNNQVLKSIVLPKTVKTISTDAFRGCRSLTSITIPDSVTTIGDSAFRNCTNLISVTIGNSVTSIGTSVFLACGSLKAFYGKWASEDNRCLLIDGILRGFAPAEVTEYNIPSNVIRIDDNVFQNYDSLTRITIPSSVVLIGNYAFDGCSNLGNIVSYSITAPVISSSSFRGIAQNGTLWCFSNSDYSTWMSTSNYYLGSLGWTNSYFEPTNYYNLSITADNAMWNATTATVQWSCLADVIDPITNEAVLGVVLTGAGISNPFTQNTSDLDIERTVVFEIFGLSGTTTITQYKYAPYTINLNNQWQKSTNITNPDSSVYDGVYESFSNYNVNNAGATMTITINGYSNFILYIRSYAESSYDYVMVSQLDQTITNSSSYSDTTLVKAHTRGNQQSGTAISNYTKVEFENIDGGEHTITIVYRKDSSANSNDDRGYVLIPKS